MTPGAIVVVDWRYAFTSSGEPNKLRPGVIVTSKRIFANELFFELVVPLTSAATLAIPEISLTIDPTPDNGCSARCYALAWNVQSVPHARLRSSPSRITEDQLSAIRDQIGRCVGAR